MSVTIIPEATTADEKKAAQDKFDGAIHDLWHVVFIVYGTGADADRIIEVASARADLSPLTRQVVWLKDPSVLTDKQQSTYVVSKPAAVVGLDDKISEELTLVRATSKVAVEKAFSKAGG